MPVSRESGHLLRGYDGGYPSYFVCGPLVFKRKAMLEATESLMSENGIPRRGSDDVLAVWNGKVARTD